MTEPHQTLLDTVFDQRSADLVDECPDAMNWEDFDPEIDHLRSRVTDLLESPSILRSR